MHEIRAWMVETMKARNWSPERWAREAGIEGTVITQYLNDPTQAPPTPPRSANSVMPQRLHFPQDRNRP
jgi:hypothetical protein